jgi:hypothetical protein
MLNSVVVHYACSQWVFHSCQMDVPVKLKCWQLFTFVSQTGLQNGIYGGPGSCFRRGASTLVQRQLSTWNNSIYMAIDRCDIFCFVQLLCNYCATCDRATVNALDESSVFTQLATSMSSHFSTDICHSGGVSRSYCSICEYMFHHYEAIWLSMGMLTHDTHQWHTSWTLGFFLLGFSRLTMITMIAVCLSVNHLHLAYSVLASHGYLSCFLTSGQFSRQLTLDKKVSWWQCVYGSAGRFSPYPRQVGVVLHMNVDYDIVYVCRSV